MRVDKKLFFGIIVFALVFILVMILVSFTGLLVLDSPEEIDYEYSEESLIIDLNVSDSDVFYWEYSLDDEERINFTPNISLGELPDGDHNVKVYGLKEEWNETYDGPPTGGGGSPRDLAYTMQKTNDGRYIIAGVTDHLGERNFWVVKVYSNGTEEWNKSFSKNGSTEDIAYSIQQTDDGGYIVAGETHYNPGIPNSDARIVKLDSAGNLQWGNSYGNPIGTDIAFSVQQTSDGGYIFAGISTTVTDSGGDVYLVKLNSNGGVLWGKAIGEEGRDEEAASVQQTDDGGYIVAGVKNQEFWVIKTASNGNEEWNKTYSGLGNQAAHSIQQTFDGGYIVAGENIFHDAVVIKTASNGTEEWNKTYDGLGNRQVSSIQRTSDGGYVVVGTEDSDFWMMKLDLTGNIQWDKTFGGLSTDLSYAAHQVSDGYVIAGSTNDDNLTGGGADHDFWIIKLIEEMDSVDFSVGEEKKVAVSSSSLRGDIESVGTIEAGEIQTSFKLSEINKNVAEISFDLNEDVPNLKISAITREFNPTFFEHKGIAQSYFEISKSGVFDSQINNVEIKFVVPVDWMKGKDVSRDSIKLLRHVESKWNDLKTEFVSRDDEYYYFIGEAPGFSPFAIVGEENSGFAEEKLIVEKPLVEKPAKERKSFFDEVKQILREFVSPRYFIVAITIICIGLISGIVFYFAWRKFNLGKKRKQGKRKRK